MRFVADESVDAEVIVQLRNQGLNVISIAETDAGINDDEVLSIATHHRAILITGDKDFGELVYRLQRVHFGVVLLRLAGLPVARKAQLAVQLILEHQQELTAAFAVLTPGSLRIRKVHPTRSSQTNPDTTTPEID